MSYQRSYYYRMPRSGAYINRHGVALIDEPIGKDVLEDISKILPIVNLIFIFYLANEVDKLRRKKR